jgi:hypothetical protein
MCRRNESTRMMGPRSYGQQLGRSQQTGIMSTRECRLQCVLNGLPSAICDVALLEILMNAVTI